VQTTWKRDIKNQRSLETTSLNKKQLGRASRLSQKTKLGGSAFASTTLGGSNSRMKDQEYKYSRLQQRQHIKTLHPISILKKSTRRRLGGCGIHNPKIFLKTRIWTLQLLQAKARGSGATLSECNFYEKLHPPKKNSEQPRRLKGPSGFLSQQARGSGATLTECTFVQKCTSAEEKTKKTISRSRFKKEPRTSLQQPGP